jgi:RHS repeat-associated protein
MKIKSCFVAIILCSILNTRAHAMGAAGFILPARYYDSEGGRFISPDSIVPSAMDPQSLNRYAYVGNNPLNFTDPSGRSKLSDVIGVHVNANRFIHHNLGINQIGFGAYAGPGGEMNFYFSDNDVKIGGGVGVGLGFHVGTSFNDLDLQTTQGAYMNIGSDPYGGHYISAGGGVGPVNGSGIYYPETNNYQVGGGVTVGRVGVGASYSSYGGTQINGGAYGVGASYGMRSGQTHYAVNPVAFAGYTKQDNKEVDYTKYNPEKTYGGPGGIGDSLVPDLWWSKAFFAHDTLFSTGKGVGGFFYADQTMASDMTTGSIAFAQAHPFLAPLIIPATAFLIPLYYSAVAVPGAIYYPFANGR